MFISYDFHSRYTGRLPHFCRVGSKSRRRTVALPKLTSRMSALLQLLVCLVLTHLPWTASFSAPSALVWLGHAVPASARFPSQPIETGRRLRAVRRVGRLDMVISPIAGASVSSDGFIVFLSCTASGRYFEQDLYIPALVSPLDTEVCEWVCVVGGVCASVCRTLH